MEVFEFVRRKIVIFVNVFIDCEIVFIWNVSEVINLVVNSWGIINFKVGDEVFIYLFLCDFVLFFLCKSNFRVG